MYTYEKYNRLTGSILSSVKLVTMQYLDCVVDYFYQKQIRICKK